MQDYGCLAWVLHAVTWLSENLKLVAALISAFAAAAGLFFAGWQIKNAARTYKVSNLIQITYHSEGLQWRALTTPELRPLLVGTENPSPLQYQVAFAGLVINHFETVFDLYELGGIPKDIFDLYKKDISVMIKSDAFKIQWVSNKKFRGKKFINMIDKIYNE